MILLHYPFQLWVDTSQSPPVLKQRNEANNAFVDLGSAAGLLGSMAVQNANAVAITGGTASLSSLTGTAVTQTDTDTTANRLTKDGDFGVPEHINLDQFDPDVVIDPGFYQDVSGDNLASRPFSSAYFLQNMRRGTTFRGVQFAFARNFPGVKFRSMRTDNQGYTNKPWQEIYHTGNSIASKDSSITTHLADRLSFANDSQRHTLININASCYFHGGIVLGEQAICEVIVDGVNLSLSTSGSRRSGVIREAAATLIPPVLATSSLIVLVGTGRSAGTRSEGEIGATAYTSLI